MAGWFAAAQGLAVVAVLAASYRPLGDALATVYTSPRDLRVEAALYRIVGVDPRTEQSWRSYVRAVLAFSAVGVLALYLMQRAQALLPGDLGLPGVDPWLAMNTAVSFVTNTDWQSASPELTVGYTVRAAGLAVQNVLSAAVGLAVVVALVRGFARRRSGTIGNFWVDLVRGTLRVLLPLSVVVALVLVVAGVVQNWSGFTEVTTLAGGTQSVPGGPVASQQAIALLGSNGGGFFNAGSAHPFENPTPWSSALQVVLMLAIPVALTRTFGRMVGDVRQGYAVLAAMATIAVLAVTALTLLEWHATGAAPAAAGGAMEGKEQRFGIAGTALFGAVGTLTSTGAVNGMHDSFSALGGMVPMLDMMLGEVAPGGVGTGLSGMLVLAVLAVFVGGLMVGRTPEYLGKKIGPREMTLASLVILVTPALVLAGTALSFAIPGVRADLEATSIANPGQHGLSEVLYAFTSAANNNGSAFAGLTASTAWLNGALAVVMLLGRFVPVVLVLALAGSLAAQDAVPTTAGTLPTHRPQYVGLLVGVTVVVTALTYVPVLALGPLAEGLR